MDCTIPRSIGEGPVGPRLAKGTRFPFEIGVDFDSKADAEKAAEEWEKWYYSQPYLKRKDPISILHESVTRIKM